MGDSGGGMRRARLFRTRLAFDKGPALCSVCGNAAPGNLWLSFISFHELVIRGSSPAD